MFRLPHNWSAALVILFWWPFALCLAPFVYPAIWLTHRKIVWRQTR